jgi:hypothetical protein
VEDIVLTAAKYPLYQQLCGRYCVNSCILFVSSWVEDIVSSVAKYPLYQQPQVKVVLSSVAKYPFQQLLGKQYFRNYFKVTSV